MHWSADGKTWRFVRAFGLTAPEELLVGVHAQAPFGPGVQTEFAFFSLTHTAVANFRNGE